MDIFLKPSKFILSFSIFLHVCSVLAICLSDISIYCKISLFPFLFLSAYYHFIHKSPRQIVRCWRRDNAWLVQDREGKEHRAQLLGSSFVSVPLIILNFRLAGAKRLSRSMLLVANHADRDLMRRLRVLLKNNQ